jgi:hypothetical protein
MFRRKIPHVEERFNMAAIFRLGHAIRPTGLVAANTRSAELLRSAGQLLEKRVIRSAWQLAVTGQQGLKSACKL